VKGGFGFTGRLRLALIGAALLPTVLIALIISIGTSQQIKKIEHDNAEEAIDRFDDYLQTTINSIKSNLHYIADDRQFGIFELQVARGNPPATYALPLLTLDFVEYLDSTGMVLLSATRPALVRERIPFDDLLPVREDTATVFRVERDLTGTHTAAGVLLATKSGYLYGGEYLDRTFRQMAQTITMADIDFVAKHGFGNAQQPIPQQGMLYRRDGRLEAVIFDNEQSQFYAAATFHPYENKGLFRNFLTAVGAVAVFSLFIVISAGLYFSSRTKQAMKELSDGAQRVSAGDFAKPVRVTEEGEFDRLADAFNDMMKQLTEYRERLIVSQKIAAWQTIGRKIAHEVKNPLTPISIAVDDLRQSYEENRQDFAQVVAQTTTAIKGEIERLRKLIDEFSSFAKMPLPEIRSTTMTSIFDEITALYREEINTGRLIIRNFAASAEVHLDPDQIKQVLLNLVKNCLEAAPDTTCQVQCILENGALHLTVTDTGPGFPQRLLADGISPYFSTKEDGTGLGLVICQRIVYDHGGAMILSNIQRGGAQVELTLPQTL
jgi:signal transduction histidine kinase